MGWVLAPAITSVVALLAFGVGLVGIGQYFEDYCFTSIEPPAAARSYAGPRFESPITLSCFYEGAGRVSQRDLAPLLYLLVVFGGSLVVVSLTWYWLLIRPRRPVVQPR